MKYDASKLERKWQKRWEKEKLFQTQDSVKGKKNFYHLVMFPYPSGDLHIGHWYNFAPADIYARFTRMRGFNVLSPIGFDAFGLPAENAAIKRKLHPAKWTMQNIEKMRGQLKSIGAMYDWSREVITCQPDYYKWTQWMFLQMYKKGLAKRKKTWANWCPSCKTVLANEQVVEGRCERCSTEVVQRQIDQWVFRITEYAERLLGDVETLDWPEKTKLMQKNWIGRSEGARIRFKVKSQKSNVVEYIEVFTTRPDTIFGATYMVLAPEHPLVASLLEIKNQKSKIKNVEEVKNYTNKALKKTPLDRQAGKEKTGVELKGIGAINPANGKEIPLFVADYVLGEYGTGAIMAVPGHDSRDYDFALAFSLPLVRVIEPYETAKSQKSNVKSQNYSVKVKDESFYEGEGRMFNSGQFNGFDSEEAKKKIVEWLAKKKLARAEVQYKIRDWIVSRQRYWGAPIPIVHCKACGQVPVPEEDLPVLLPDLEDFRPADDGRSPLARSKEFLHTSCPKCGGSAERETDTMDTFVDSSWYYFRYTDPKNTRVFAEKEKMKQWLPVSLYIGGAEHTVLHLLYSRFFTKVLFDLGYVWFEEPFLKLRHQGIILGPDGQKMSKSRGNVIDPDELVAEHGTDVVRTYLAFMGPYDQGGPWSPGAIAGIVRFFERAVRIVDKYTRDKRPRTQDATIDRVLHKTIKKVSEDLAALKFNTAVASLMVLASELQGKEKEVTNFIAESFVRMLAPFAPHLAEELWRSLGHTTSVHVEEWPVFDESLVKDDLVTMIVQVNGKMRGRIKVNAGALEEEASAKALGEGRVKEFVKGAHVKKTIFVPDKLINFVV